MPTFEASVSITNVSENPKEQYKCVVTASFKALNATSITSDQQKAFFLSKSVNGAAMVA